MDGIYIVNEDGIAQIVANDYFGAYFKCNIFNQDDNTYLQENLSMTEIEEPYDTNSTTTDGNHDSGVSSISLSDSSGFSISDRVKIGNYIYKITNIDGNSITTHKPLYENISDGSSVDRVGNLGIYKVSLNIDTLGTYTLIGKDTVFGLNTTKMIKVVPKSIAEMYKDIKNLEYAILGS